MKNQPGKILVFSGSGEISDLNISKIKYNVGLVHIKQVIWM